MSEYVTHLAVVEDSVRLVSQNSGFSPIMLSCLKDYPEATRLGSVTRSGDNFIFPLLEKWKGQWEDREIQRKKMAYILGWAGHLAADRTFKPIFRIADLAYYIRDLPGPTHASIYHDSITLKEVFGNGNQKPFHRSILTPWLSGHKAASFIPVQLIEYSFSMVQLADMSRFKLFLTESRNRDKEFLENTENEKQQFYVDLDRYTKAFHYPDVSKLRQYIIEQNFYDRTDPIIELARQIQRNEATTIPLEKSLQGVEKQSQYAQAIKLGYDFLMACSDFFSGNIDLAEAKIRMRTHTRHSEPLDYYIRLAESKKGE